MQLRLFPRLANCHLRNPRVRSLNGRPSHGDDALGRQDDGIGGFLVELHPHHPVDQPLAGATGQWGLINVNNMKTEEPDTEVGIVEMVCSYGKQLGQITEASKPSANGWIRRVGPMSSERP